MANLDNEIYETMASLDLYGGLSPEEKAEYEAERQRRNQVSKKELVAYALQQDPDSMSEEDAAGLSNLWAQRMDMGNSQLADQPGPRTSLTGDQYFQQHKNPRDRVRYIQNKYEPNRHKDMLSDYQKFTRLTFEEKVAQAEGDYGRELFGLLPPRESVPENFFREALSGITAHPMTMPSPEMVPERLRLLGIDPSDPKEQFGITTPEKRERLVKRVEGALLQKDLASLRARYDSLLSEPAKEWAKQVANTGVFDPVVLESLPLAEQEIAARYARVLRDYSGAGALAEFISKGGASVWGVAEGTYKQVQTGLVEGVVAVESIWNDEAGQTLLALDDFKRIDRMKDLALSTKYEERGALVEGAMVLADSLGPMLFAAKTGPLQALRGTMAIASYANSTQDMMLDAGAKPEDAALMAPIAGVAMFYTERISSALNLDEAGKKVASKVIAKTVLEQSSKLTRRMARAGIRVGTRAAESAATETLEEILQSAEEELAKQAALGKSSLSDLAGVTAETIEVMAKASIWFGGLGEVSRTSSSIITRFGPGRADMEANDLIAATDEFESKADAPTITADEILDILPDDITVDTATKVLERQGVLDAEPIAKGMVNAKKAEVRAGKKAAKEAEAAFPVRDITAKEEAQITKLAKKYGMEVEIVEEVASETERLEEGVFRDDKVVLSRAVEHDPVRAAREEIFHGLRKRGEVEAADWEYFQGEAEALIKETGVDVDYADMDSVQQLEEAVAKKFADYTPEQKSIFRRVFDWLKKIVGLNKETGTKTADQIFQKIEDRTYTGERKAAPVEGQAEQFSRFSPRAARAMATRVAIGRVAEGRKISTQQLQKMFPDADLDFDSILQEAREEVQSTQEFEEGVSSQAAFYTKAARRLEVKRARREAVRVGRQAATAEVLAKREAKEVAKRKQVKAMAKNNGVATIDVRREHNLDVEAEIRAGGDVVNRLIDIAKATSSVDDGAVLAHHVARTLSKSLKKAARTLVSNRTVKATKKADLVARAGKIGNYKSIKGATTASQKLVDDIRKNMVEQSEDAMAKEITAALKPFKKAAPKTEREIKRKGVDRKAYEVLHKAGKYWRMTPREFDQAKAGLNVDLRAMTTTSTNPLDMKARYDVETSLIAVRMVDHAKRAGDVAALEQALNDIQLFILQGHKDLNEKQAQHNQQRDADKAKLVEDLKKQREGKAPRDPDAKDMLARYMSPVDMLESLTTTEGGKALAGELQQGIDRQWNLAKTEGLRILNKAEKIAKKHGYADFADLQRKMRKPSTKYVKYSEQGRVKLTKADLLKIRAQLLRGDIDLHSDNPHVQRRLKQLPSLEAEFAPKELAVVDEIQELLQTVYTSDALVDQVLHTTGLPPVVIDNYFPYDWNHEVSGGGGVVRLVSDIPGWLIPAVPHKLDFQEGGADFFNSWGNHLDELVRYKHFDGMKTRIKSGVLSPEVMGEIEKTYGKDTRKVFDNTLTSMIAGQPLLRKTDLDEGLTEKVWGGLCAGTAYSALMFRIPSMLRQVGGIFSALLQMDGQMAKQVMSRMWSSEGLTAAKTFLKHPLMQERMRGRIDPGSVNILDRIGDLSAGKVRTVLSAGMRVPGMGDVLTFALVGGQMVEIYLASDPQFKMMPEKEARDAATAEVVGMFERVLQSTEIKDLSPQISSAGKFKRGFTQFMSADLAVLSKEVMAYRQWRAGTPGGGQRLAKVLAINHLLLPLPQLMTSFLFQNIFKGDDFDDDEMLEIAMSVLAGPMRGIAIIGALTFAFASKSGSPSWSTPAQRLYGNITNALVALKDTDPTDSDEVLELLDKWLKMLGTYRDTKDVKKFMEDNL